MNGLDGANGMNDRENQTIQNAPELLGREVAPLGEIIEAYPMNGCASGDRKYKVHFHGYDSAYLLRLFGESSLSLKRAEFEALHRMQALTVHCSRPIAMGRWGTEGLYFLLVSYIDGTDAGQALPLSSKPQQLRIGMQAGEELRRIRCHSAPAGTEDWRSRYRRRTERELELLQKHGISSRGLEAAAEKIRSAAGLTEKRPSAFLHGNFDPAHLIVQGGRLTGVIGFGRFGWGDPLYDFARLGLHSRSVSPLFCTGQILGYHGGQEPGREFWGFYALYAASGAVSLAAESLGRPREELFTAIELADRLAADHDGFADDSPSWFGVL
ncbi:phosphotransferase family protein [Saccharibacillus alkalitolerans]|uniref:Aminoglycoside phosphotransferase family protein n=1 Tax=Saccharibacillus alkalitolerans TaxID=2705290 RepID=A0ABX0F3Q2_9BACL|nr:aminoglycoside phosphotransferase family protein [Saccharibacillus alkalitolerans]NGZ75607.1 aminoglycoside phosphotransferase family protein [Saccharibacillus alkalitolerans]